MKEIEIIIENPEQGIANYEPLKAWALEQAAVYGNLLVNPDAIKDAKSDMAMLRKMAKAASDIRIRITKEHEAKISTVISQLKEVTKIFTDAASNIDTQVKEYDEQRRRAREAEIGAIYAEEIGDMDIELPLVKIFDISWMNKTTSVKTIRSDMQTKIYAVREALAQIREYHSKHEAVMIFEYLRRLSITDALEAKKRLEAIEAEEEKRKQEADDKAWREEEQKLVEEEQKIQAPKKLTVIEFAEKRMQEEEKAGNEQTVLYWAAYLDGARAQKKEDEL